MSNSPSSPPPTSTGSPEALRPLVLVPAAGYGRRVGSPPAKELLPRPPEGQSGKLIEPLILKPLQLARERGWPSLVITRPDKQELVEYLKGLQDEGYDVQIQLIAPTPDWPHTLLASQSHWHLHNLVILPDTEWSPPAVLDELHRALVDGAQVAWAAHLVDNLSTWGTIKELNPHQLEICEKPKNQDSGWAWGLIAFQKTAGKNLFTAQGQSTLDHQAHQIEARGRQFALESFYDLTRNPKADIETKPS